MVKSPKRIAIHICNIIISILCILSIAMYFIQPLWKIDVSYTLSGDMVEEMFKGMLPSDEGGGEGEGEGMDDINLELHDIPLHLSLTFETADILSSLSEEPTASIQKMIDTNVSMLVDDLTVELNDFVKEVVKALSKKTVTSSVKEQVKNILGESTTTEEVDQVLQDAGITDSYIEDKTDALIESIYEEDATVESVTDEVINVVEETFDMIAQNGNPEFADALTEETKEEIRNAVSEALSSIADENGNLNIDELIASGILDMLNGSLGGEGSGNGDGGDSSQPSPTSNRGFAAGIAKPLNEGVEDSSQTSDSANDSSSGSDIDDEQQEADLYAELKAKLLEEIHKALPEDIVSYIAEGMKIVAYVLLFTFATWAYLIVKILCKLVKTNNAIKVGVPIWWGCLPFLILYAVPNFVLPPVLNMVAPAEIASALSLSFTSGSWFSFVAAVVLALLSIFYYGGLRRYLKKVEKGLIIIDTPATQTATEKTDASDVDEPDTVSETVSETATAETKPAPAKTEESNNDVVQDVDEV